MPRFPDYVAQEGLTVSPAPQIEANTAVGKSLTSLGNTLQEAGQRWTERQKQQADFDDQIAYQRYTLAQDQALQQAQAGMPPEATGFHDTVMADRTQADGDFLQTVSPANRDRYAGLLALGRDRASLAAARMEFEGRGAYEQAAFGQSVSDMADAVRGTPDLLPSALDALKAQQANQSSVLPAARDAQWLATRQALQLAGWQGRYGDDPSGQGLAALGVKLSPENAAALPLLMDEGPVDPSVDALTPMQRQQTALQWQTKQAQKQAAAKADLDGLQQRLAAMPLTGQLDGPPPDRQTFVTAYGPDNGAQRFDEVGAFLKDAPAITALLHQPDGAQDAALAHYANATDADGQRFHRNAGAAVARYRAERAADPVGTLGKLYPGLAQGWSAVANADPATLRQALPQLVGQTAALMDAAGVPPGERRYLPNWLATDVVQNFHDTAKPLAERIAPLQMVATSTSGPWQQVQLSAQLSQAGLPPKMQAAGMAFARGKTATAGRIAQAIVSPPSPASRDVAADASPVEYIRVDPFGNPDFSHPIHADGSPIGDSATNTAVSATAPAQPAASPAAPTIRDGAGDARVNADRVRALHRIMTETNFASNGGDYPAAVDLANQDLFGSPGGGIPSWMTDPDYLRTTWAQGQSLDAIQQAYRDAQAQGDKAAQRSYAMAYVEKEHEESPLSMSVDDRARALSRGIPILGGAADEVNAALSAPLSAFFGDGKAYEEALDYQRARDSYFDRKYPWTSNALQFAGAIASMAVVGPAAAPSSLGGGIAMGAALGGADGFTRGEEGFWNRMGTAGTGAAVGGAMGAAGPVLSRAATRVGRSLAEKYPAMFGRGGQQAATSGDAPLPSKSATADMADSESPSTEPPGENSDEIQSSNNNSDKNKTETNSPKEDGSEEGTSAPPENIIVVRLKYKPGWSDAQRADADAKIAYLNSIKAVVTKPERTIKNLRAYYKRKIGEILKKYDVDHKHDLQLGGKDEDSNLWLLDYSVNRSLGAQIARAIKIHPKGTVIHRFEIY